MVRLAAYAHCGSLAAIQEALPDPAELVALPHPRRRQFPLLTGST